MKIKDLFASEYCPEEFMDCDVIYHNDWSTYEENGWVVVFDFFGEMFEWSYEYSVFAEDNSVHFDPCVIDEDQLASIKKYWDESVESAHEEMQ